MCSRSFANFKSKIEFATNGFFKNSLQIYDDEQYFQHLNFYCRHEKDNLIILITKPKNLSGVRISNKIGNANFFCLKNSRIDFDHQDDLFVLKPKTISILNNNKKAKDSYIISNIKKNSGKKSCKDTIYQFTSNSEIKKTSQLNANCSVFVVIKHK